MLGVHRANIGAEEFAAVWLPDQIVIQPNCSSVEHDMVVRAEAKKVLLAIRSIVRPSQWADVCCLRIGRAGKFYPKVAKLAAILVQLLYLPRERVVSNNPQNR